MTPLDIIAVTTADWDSPLWTNKQHLMQALARRGHRILYVESVGLRAPHWSRTDMGRMGRRLVRRLEGLRSPEPNLYTWSPLLLPWYGSSWARALNARSLQRDLSQAADRLAMKRPVLWAFAPVAPQVTARLVPSRVVFHVVDDLSQVNGVPRRAIREMADQFAQTAHHVVVSSEVLRREWERRHPDVRLWPNVTHPAHFQTRSASDVVRPEGLKNLGGPLIGYVGAMDREKIDGALIRAVAQALPDCEFVMVGPKAAGRPWHGDREMADLPNVHWIGGVPYREVPHYLEAFRVALLPHRQTPYTAAACPLKLREYQAAGLPVVSTKLPGLAGEPGVYVADDVPQFVDAVRMALAEDGHGEAERTARAAQFSWDWRVQQVEDLLAESGRVEIPAYPAYHP